MTQQSKIKELKQEIVALFGLCSRKVLLVIIKIFAEIRILFISVGKPDFGVSNQSPPYRISSQ